MRPLLSLVAAALFVGGVSATAQQPAPNVRIVPVTRSITMLQISGGNIAVSHGPDGVFVVDDDVVEVGDSVMAAIARVDSRPVRFVVNTHWHGDHTGNNERLAGTGAIVLAHDNVRQRMSTNQFIELMKRKVPASPRAALPVVTFADSLTLHLNDSVRVIHVVNGHTDGDAFVVFEEENVIHAGDLFFNGFYPFIDLSSGGSVDGLIAGVNRLIGESDNRSKIIPGHGPLARRADLVAYRDMLTDVRTRIATLITAGRTLDQVKAAKPTARYDATWGNGFIKPDVFTEIVYTSLFADRMADRLRPRIRGPRKP